ncbi:hypothetical protein [Alistipes sp.]|uniref:hypothetical protein n=1 Tax=Alistipes sp. TaxID=1872444 RepID=UPI003AEF2782
MILEGLLSINGIDPWTEYGAFLVEEKPGDMKNYTALLKPSAVKPQKEVSFREMDGAKVPPRIVQRWEARDVTLQFCIFAADRKEFHARYSGFLEMLRTGVNGWLDIHLPELDRHFKMFYKECSDYKQLTDFEGEVAGRFSVKFREPNPTF